MNDIVCALIKPSKYLTTELQYPDPLESCFRPIVKWKFSADTSWLFLNMFKDNFKPIKNIGLKVYFRCVWNLL